MNIGSYVILPTPAATTFISEWAASASSAIQAKQQDQFFLPNLQHLYELCATPGSCLAKRTEVRPCSAHGQSALPPCQHQFPWLMLCCMHVDLLFAWQAGPSSKQAGWLALDRQSHNAITGSVLPPRLAACGWSESALPHVPAILLVL